MLLAQAKMMLTRASRSAMALMKVFERSYEPSKHYMRGPGPKSRAAADRGDHTAAAGRGTSAHG